MCARAISTMYGMGTFPLSCVLSIDRCRRTAASTGRPCGCSPTRFRLMGTDDMLPAMNKNVGSALIGSSIAAVGVLGAVPFLPARARLVVEGLPTTVFTVFALFLLAAGIALVLFSRFRENIRVDDHYCTVARTHDQLRQVHEFAKMFFGEDVSQLALMKEWRRKYRRAFIVIMRRRANKVRTDEQLVGYFCLLPLQKSATEMILSGQLRGSALRPDDLASGGKYASIYLGAVAAKGLTARALAVAFVRRELEDHWVGAARRSIVTRPLTNDGLRLARKYSFLMPSGAAPILGNICCAEARNLMTSAPRPSQIPQRRGATGERRRRHTVH
jgi:hypothetical protein